MTHWSSHLPLINHLWHLLLSDVSPHHALALDPLCSSRLCHLTQSHFSIGNNFDPFLSLKVPPLTKTTSTMPTQTRGGRSSSSTSHDSDDLRIEEGRSFTPSIPLEVFLWWCIPFIWRLQAFLLERVAMSVSGGGWVREHYSFEGSSRMARAQRRGQEEEGRIR